MKRLIHLKFVLLLLAAFALLLAPCLFLRGETISITTSTTSLQRARPSTFTREAITLTISRNETTTANYVLLDVAYRDALGMSLTTEQLQNDFGNKRLSIEQNFRLTNYVAFLAGQKEVTLTLLAPSANFRANLATILTVKITPLQKDAIVYAYDTLATRGSVSIMLADNSSATSYPVLLNTPQSRTIADGYENVDDIDNREELRSNGFPASIFVNESGSPLIYTIAVSDGHNYTQDTTLFVAQMRTPAERTRIARLTNPNAPEIKRYGLYLRAKKLPDYLLGRVYFTVFIYAIDPKTQASAATGMLVEIVRRPRQITSDVTDTEVMRVTAYPNPTTDYVLLDNMRYGSQVVVSELSGREVVRIERAQTSERLDFTSLPAGMYFVTVRDEEKWVVKKIIKL